MVSPFVMINTTAAQAGFNLVSATPASSNMIDRPNYSAPWVRLKVSATAIWSAAASEARRRFGLCLCHIYLKTSFSSQSGVALRLPPHSIKSRSVTDSFNHTPLRFGPAARAGVVAASFEVDKSLLNSQLYS